MTTTAAVISTKTSWSTWKATRASPPATPRAGRWVRPGCPDDAPYGHFPLDPRRHRRHSAARDRRRVRQARVHESLRLDQGAHRLVHGREGGAAGPAQARRPDRGSAQRQYRQRAVHGGGGEGLPAAGGEARRPVDGGRGGRNNGGW